MFPVINVDGEFIESKHLICGFPVMTYVDFVAASGIYLILFEMFFDLAIGVCIVFSVLIQICQIISYLLIIRLQNKTSILYILGMAVNGFAIWLRLVLMIGLGIPAILESQSSFRKRMETNKIYDFLAPSHALELTDDVLSGVRYKVLFFVISSTLIVVISFIFFLFIERARELAKYEPENVKEITPEEMERGKGEASKTILAKN